MDHEKLIDALRTEGEALGEVRIADVDVPTCPDWTLPDLLRHVGNVHRWQHAQVVATDPAQLVRTDRNEEVSLDALADWYREGLTALVTALTQIDPDALTPSWHGPRPATFWARRAAHETAIHRWDAQAAVSAADPLDPDQAVDIIDELLEVLAPFRFRSEDWDGPEVTIHLHATDIEGEWLVGLGSDGLRVERVHAKGDVAARGPASDLALMVTGRMPAARLEVFGDPAVLDRWGGAIRF